MKVTKLLCKKLLCSIFCSKFTKNSPASIYNVKKIFQGLSPRTPTGREEEGKEGKGRKERRRGKERGERKDRVGSPDFQDVVAHMRMRQLTAVRRLV
jgi:hypothetical protein